MESTVLLVSCLLGTCLVALTVSFQRAKILIRERRKRGKKLHWQLSVGNPLGFYGYIDLICWVV